jgi:hypothetical protein
VNVLSSTRRPFLFDPELVLAKIGDRPVVAAENDHVELDQIAGGGGRRLRTLTGHGRGEDGGGGRRDPPDHARAFSITASAAGVRR